MTTVIEELIYIGKAVLKGDGQPMELEQPIKKKEFVIECYHDSNGDLKQFYEPGTQYVALRNPCDEFFGVLNEMNLQFIDRDDGYQLMFRKHDNGFYELLAHADTYQHNYYMCKAIWDKYFLHKIK